MADQHGGWRIKDAFNGNAAADGPGSSSVAATKLVVRKECAIPRVGCGKDGRKHSSARDCHQFYWLMKTCLPTPPISSAALSEVGRPLYADDESP